MDVRLPHLFSTALLMDITVIIYVIVCGFLHNQHLFKTSREHRIILPTCCGLAYDIKGGKRQGLTLKNQSQISAVRTVCVCDQHNWDQGVTSPLQFDTAQALLIHDGRCVHKLYTSFSGLPNHYRPHCIHLIKAGVSGHRNTQLSATN